MSRSAARDAKGLELFYPPVPECVAYLVAHWRDLGRVGTTGMGAMRLSCLEVAAWVDLTGNSLEPWEVEAVRAMSTAFLAETHEAEDPGRPPPWEPEDTEVKVAEKAALAKSIRSTLRG